MQHAWRDFAATDARPIPYHEALRFGPAFPSTFPSTFPEDAHARIHRPARSATTSGKARTKDWVLRFERRTPPIIEPLMGWTGGDDTLTQVELRFPTLEAAIAYAERQGLAYRVEGAGRTDRRAMEREEAQRRALEEVFASLVLFAWAQVRYGRCDLPDSPDLDRALTDPAAAFGSPQEILGHPLLTFDCKREILRRWAWDEHLQELAAAEAMPERGPSRLDEVVAALAALDGAPTLVTFHAPPRRAAREPQPARQER